MKKIKVGDLKIINNYLRQKNCSLKNYKGLFQFHEEDISLIVEQIQKGNENAKILIQFFDYEIDDNENNTRWIEMFNHLEGLNDFDIRSYMIDKICNASSVEKADNIFRYSDQDGRYADIIELFSTLEEWQTYIECITENMDDTASYNVSLVLKKATDNRIELIKQVMEYSQNDDLNQYNIDKNFSEEAIEKFLSDIIFLLNKGYNMTEVRKFFVNWIGDINADHFASSVEDCIDDRYSSVLTYLKETEMFDYGYDNSSLMEMFNDAPVTEYYEMISLLKEIEEAKDEELYKTILKYRNLDKSIMREFYAETLVAKEHNKDSYRNWLLRLLDEEILIDNINDVDTFKYIWLAVKISEENGCDAVSLVDFIEGLPIPKIIGKLHIENQDILNIIYNNFSECIVEGPFTEEEIEYYGKWLGELSKLPVDVCEKIMNILKLSVVKNLELKDQINLQEILLNPENFGSLDCIYQQYLDREEKYQEYKRNLEQPKIQDSKANYSNEPVQLSTVFDLLMSGKDVDKVLDGFSDEEEITEKTLIRSLTYKNQ